MISGHKIFKSYSNLTILKGVDLHVEHGEIVAIVGASGAGKSTLLQILGTLEAPDNGWIEINHIDPNKLSSKKLAEFRNKHIGFIFQFHHLLPEFTVLENVSIPGYIAGRKNAELKSAAINLLEILGVADKANTKPSVLSGGEQQRVAIARALINSPSVVLADEPTGNLDSQNAELLHSLIHKLRAELNQTFLIVTHNTALAEMADRQLKMADGIIVNNKKS
ncbi:MAG: ABC transporter ATP-binding protein [Bacteroidota bacterium]|nr:ABC transporter ATP-binding protein [Bacteroidota bacterium]